MDALLNLKRRCAEAFNWLKCRTLFSLHPSLSQLLAVEAANTTMPPTRGSLSSSGDKWYRNQPIALVIQLLSDQQYFWLFTSLLFLGEAALSFLIIRKVPCMSPQAPVPVNGH